MHMHGDAECPNYKGNKFDALTDLCFLMLLLYIT